MKPRKKSGAAWLLQQAPGFKPSPDPLHQGVLAGGGIWDFPNRFLFPHGQDLHMNLPLQWVPAWAGKSNPMKTAWDFCPSILHPGPMVPGHCLPLGRVLCVGWGEPRGLAGSSVELLRMEKSPGSALSLRRHLSWEVFFFPSSQHGRLEISYAGSGCDVFITQRTVWQSPEKLFAN